MTKPKFPIITVYKDYLEVILGEAELETANALAVKKVKNAFAYDVKGINCTYDFTSEQIKKQFLDTTYSFMHGLMKRTLIDLFY